MLLQAIVSGLIGAYTALTGVMAGLAAGEDLASIAATALGSAELIALAPMLLIVAAIAAVIAIGYLLITHWSQVTAAAQAVWVEIQKIWGDIEAFVGHAVQGILDWLGAHWPLVISIVLGPLGAVLALVITHWTQIHDFIATAIADVESFLSNTWNRIVSAAETAWSQFASRPLYWIGYLLVWIPLTILKIEAAIFEWFMNLIDMAEQKAADFVGSIINWITTLPGAIAGFLSQAWTNVTAWAGQMVASAQTTGSNFLAAVVNEIQQLPGQVWAFLLNTYNGLVTWAGDMLTQAQQAATSVVSAIVTEIGQLPAQMVQTGSDIVKGLWNGISSMGGWIEQQVGNFAGGILDGFKGALGIKSPSTVMAQQVGLPIAQGIANGILSGQDLVIAASKQVTGAALSASAAMAGGSTFSGINSQQMQPFGSGSISSSAMADQFVAVIGANLASQLGLGNNMAQQVGLAALINGPLASKVGVNPASVLNMDLTTLQKPGGIEDAVFGALQGMDEGQLLDALGQTRPGAISTTYNLTINGEPDSATLQQLQQMLEQHTQDVAQALTAGA
jgi:phage-related protein